MNIGGAAITKSMIRMQDGDDDRGGGTSRGTAVIARTKPKTKKPSLYRVLILNDDYTPMEFVVHVLERFFQKDREAATRIMLHVHNHGVGECGSIHLKWPRPKCHRSWTSPVRISIRCNA